MRENTMRVRGKISAQPHTTLCIQFLDRENNDKNNRLPLGMADLFYNSMGLCGNFTGCGIAVLRVRQSRKFDFNGM